MLPGVELARKRRIHSRGGAGGAQGAVDTQRGCFSWSPSPPRDLQLLRPPAAMDEAALLAKRRLEKKLRGFGRGMSAGLCPANFSDERNLGGKPEGRAHRRATAASGGGDASAARSVEKPPPMPSAAATEGARPASSTERVMSSPGEDCAVCLDGMGAGDGRLVLSLPCAHRYHADCVLPWLAAHPSCPSCRTPLSS